jgi:proline iminopeptidase
MSLKLISFSIICLSVLSACDPKDSGKKEPVDLANLSSARQIQLSNYDNETQKTALSKFITGQEFCEKYRSVTSNENGFYVTVPIDYTDLSKGTTQIWAFFSSGPFNAEKPTVIFFDGGSGGNSHGHPALLNSFNELHYDQRGIGCSHPTTMALYRDPNFYSNLNNAKDADEIRKALKIQKVSLFGASYGTVVATIYASMFAEHSTGVILDGVEFSSSDKSQVINHYLKKTYKQLSDGTKAGLKNYIKSPNQVARVWSLARLLMYDEQPFVLLKTYIEKAFPSEFEIDQPLADKLFGENLFTDQFFGDTIDSVEAFNNQMLNCKNSPTKDTMDISFFGPYGSTYANFDTIAYPIDRSESCDAINAKPETPVYLATQFPISIPVTYFQGNLDSATVAPGAIRHYKEVPMKSKQLFIAVGAGHCPGTRALMAKNKAAVHIAESALLGKMSSKEETAQLNVEQKTVKWVFTSKQQ